MTIFGVLLAVLRVLAIVVAVLAVLVFAALLSRGWRPAFGREHMTEEAFWSIISTVVPVPPLDELSLEHAIKRLSRYPEKDIERFEEILGQKLFALDTVHHARQIGECSWRAG